MSISYDDNRYTIFFTPVTFIQPKGNYWIRKESEIDEEQEEKYLMEIKMELVTPRTDRQTRQNRHKNNDWNDYDEDCNIRRNINFSLALKRFQIFLLTSKSVKLPYLSSDDDDSSTFCQFYKPSVSGFVCPESH